MKERRSITTSYARRRQVRIFSKRFISLPSSPPEAESLGTRCMAWSALDDHPLIPSSFEEGMARNLSAVFLAKRQGWWSQILNHEQVFSPHNVDTLFLPFAKQFQEKITVRLNNDSHRRWDEGVNLSFQQIMGGGGDHNGFLQRRFPASYHSELSQSSQEG